MANSIDWNNMSNNGIREKLKQMEFEYDSIKEDILKLMDRLNELDIEYSNGTNKLNERRKK